MSHLGLRDRTDRCFNCNKGGFICDHQLQGSELFMADLCRFRRWNPIKWQISRHRRRKPKIWKTILSILCDVSLWTDLRDAVGGEKKFAKCDFQNQKWVLPDFHIEVHSFFATRVAHCSTHVGRTFWSWFVLLRETCVLDNNANKPFFARAQLRTARFISGAYRVSYLCVIQSSLLTRAW